MTWYIRNLGIVVAWRAYNVQIFLLCHAGFLSSTVTLLQTNREVERGPFTTTILSVGPSMGFHVNLRKGTLLSLPSTSWMI